MRKETNRMLRAMRLMNEGISTRVSARWDFMTRQIVLTCKGQTAIHIREEVFSEVAFPQSWIRSTLPEWAHFVATELYLAWSGQSGANGDTDQPAKDDSWVSRVNKAAKQVSAGPGCVSVSWAHDFGDPVQCVWMLEHPDHDTWNVTHGLFVGRALGESYVIITQEHPGWARPALRRMVRAYHREPVTAPAQVTGKTPLDLLLLEIERIQAEKSEVYVWWDAGPRVVGFRQEDERRYVSGTYFDSEKCGAARKSLPRWAWPAFRRLEAAYNGWWTPTVPRQSEMTARMVLLHWAEIAFWLRLAILALDHGMTGGATDDKVGFHIALSSDDRVLARRCRHDEIRRRLAERADTPAILSVDHGWDVDE